MKTTLTAIALSLALAVPAFAAPVIDDTAKGQRLDQLFQQLKAPQTQADALVAENEIEAIWFASGDPAVDMQMQAVVQAMDGQFYDGALRVLNSIILNHPNYAEAWNQRATLYYLVGNYQASLNDIAQTLTLEPRHFGAIAGKGMVYVAMGKNQDALAAFRQALAIDPALDNVAEEIKVLEGHLGLQRT